MSWPTTWRRSRGRRAADPRSGGGHRPTRRCSDDRDANFADVITSVSHHKLVIENYPIKLQVCGMIDVSFRLDTMFGRSGRPSLPENQLQPLATQPWDHSIGSRRKRTFGEDANGLRGAPSRTVASSIDKANLAGPTRSEILIPSGSQSEFPDERVRDWLARREGDASLGGLEPGRGKVVGMRLDGGRR